MPGAAKTLSSILGLQKTLFAEHQSSKLSSNPDSLKVELPGGSPLSLCEVSRPTDLFNITSVEVTKQPIYMYADHDFDMPTQTSTENSE